MEYEQLEKKLSSISKIHSWQTTPGEIVKLIGGSRRSWKLIEEVETLLGKYDLIAIPAFSNAYSHGQILIQKKVQKTEEIPIETTTLPLQMACQIGAPKGSNCDPIPRLSRLPSANLRHPEDRNKVKLISVQRESTIEEAITLMIKYNYSQLPIMNGPRRVEGIISWRSIGKAKCLGKSLTRVYDCKEEVEIVSVHTPLLEVVERVQKKEVVLVRDSDEVICGIITNTDITEQFLAQAEPFFLIEQIEKMIRIILISSNIKLEEMVALLDPNKLDKDIKSISDFTFGQYILILQNAELFHRLNLSVSRLKLMEYLEQIHGIRNEVMHFAIDKIPTEDVQHLRETLHLLTEITI